MESSVTIAVFVLLFVAAVAVIIRAANAMGELFELNVEPTDDDQVCGTAHRGVIAACIRGIAARMWQACEDHQWIPFAVMMFGLVIVNMDW